MGVRRFRALLYALGYESKSERPQESVLSSKDEMRQFFGGAIRASGGE